MLVEGHNTIIELLNISREKLKNLDEILKLTRVQKLLIEQQDMDKLNRIINNKQRHIESINILDEKFSRQFEAIKKGNDISDLTQLDVERSELKVLKDLTKQVDEKMKEIFNLEKQNQGLMTKNFEDVKSKLKEIKKGKSTTAKYYGKFVQTDGYFIDKKK